MDCALQIDKTLHFRDGSRWRKRREYWGRKFLFWRSTFPPSRRGSPSRRSRWGRTRGVWSGAPRPRRSWEVSPCPPQVTRERVSNSPLTVTWCREASREVTVLPSHRSHPQVPAVSGQWNSRLNSPTENIQCFHRFSLKCFSQNLWILFL